MEATQPELMIHDPECSGELRHVSLCYRDPVAAVARCTAERSLFMCACVNQTCGMLNRLRQAAEGESAWNKVSVRHRTGQRQGRRTIKWFDILKM